MMNREILMAWATQLAPWGPLPLSGVALAFAIRANAQLRAVRREALAWNALNLSLLTARQALAGRELHQGGDTVVPAPELPQPPVFAEEAAASPAEARSLEVQDQLEPFREALDQWIRSAGTAPVAFDEVLLLLESLSHDLEGADFDSIDQIEATFRKLQPDLLQSLLSKTDRDLDPEGSNVQLQAALNSLLLQAGLQTIQPGEGAVPDRRLHTSTGVYKRGTPEQRGTVGAVRCRGLQTNAGVVLLKAEILEFD